MKNYDIYCDGACKPNPGNMSIGVVIYDRDTQKKIHTISERIGHGTNNIAEWTSLLEAIKYMNRIEEEANIIIYMDSMLVVRQVSSQWAVGNEALAIIHKALMPILNKFTWSINYIPRAQNAEADLAANEAFE